LQSEDVSPLSASPEDEGIEFEEIDVKALKFLETRAGLLLRTYHDEDLTPSSVVGKLLESEKAILRSYLTPTG